MKKIKNNKLKKEFTKHDLMFPDLTQIKLEQAQLEAHKKTTERIGKILDVLLLMISKIKNIESFILKNRENGNDSKRRKY